MPAKITTTNFVEAKRAVNKIKQLLPKLTESEKLTLELLLDQEAMDNLEKSLKDAKAGRIISLDEAKRQLL